MKIAYDDYLTISVWWGRNETFDSEKSKPMKGDFSDGGNKQILGCWVGSFPISRVAHKGAGEGGTVHT